MGKEEFVLIVKITAKAAFIALALIGMVIVWQH